MPTMQDDERHYGGREEGADDRPMSKRPGDSHSPIRAVLDEADTEISQLQKAVEILYEKVQPITSAEEDAMAKVQEIKVMPGSSEVVIRIKSHAERIESTREKIQQITRSLEV